ncbi:MAG: 2-oxoacid:acceptor oxidoreductase family protein [Thermodesulfobacteriota bacterium]
MYFDLIIAGFGGQGVLFIGNLLAYAAMSEGHKCTYMPVYGVEMRGGTANCTVVVSDEEIGSPIIHYPVCAIVMNKPSLVKFGPRVKKDGLLLVNASLIKPREVKVKGPEVLMVPAIELAREAGNDRLANMVILGAMTGRTDATTIESLTRAMEETLPERSHNMIPVNTRAMEKGFEFARNGK